VAAVVSVAGVPAERFCFEGFLPPRAGARAERLAALAREPRAIVLFEAGRRLPGLLAAAAEAMGEREAVVAREVTKRHEEWLRGTLPELVRRVGDGAAVRGEVVVLIAAHARATSPETLDETALDARLAAALAAGSSVRDAAAALAAETGRPRRDLYRRALALGRYQPSTYANMSGATMDASDSTMNFGVFASSLPHVIFSLGTAPE
jgi:16S rRNA (cytidine1402-2'-O)-methyltransferase